ncbi:DNA-binding response regulator OS=Rhodanobacter lindaniclasticus OX=75310 GN=B1991_05480 PE=4 SV=1 [Rhodanobacter lindaniclasticus]
MPGIVPQLLPAPESPWRSSCIREDDPSIADRHPCPLLRQGGHAVDSVADGGQADAARSRYNLLVLDTALPVLDGSSKRLRHRGKGLWVVTARNSSWPNAFGRLDLGTNSWSSRSHWPSWRHTCARCCSRSQPGKLELHWGRLRLDLPGHRAWVGGRRAPIPAC